MSVDVVYQGLSIAKEARVHFEEGGLFVEVDGPMPVATQLTLSHSDKTATATFLGRVRRVRESAAPGTTPPAGHKAGMLIVPVESAEKLPRWLMALSPETVGAAEFQPEAAPPPPEPTPALEPTPAPSAASPEPAHEAAHESDADEKKQAASSGGSKKKKKKR